MKMLFAKVSPIAALAIFALAAGPGVAVGQTQTAQGRLYLLIVADTLADPTNQLGFRMDVLNVERVFKEAFEPTDQDPKRSDRLKVTTLVGPRVSPQDIRGYYKRLDVKREDTVVFYYSGHGDWDRKQGQFLRMKRGDLLRTEVLALMNNKHPRLIALITDCCSTQSRFRGTPLLGAPRGNWDVVRRLFLQPHGIVNITAAQQGKAAYGDVNGGVFTRAFTWLLCGAGGRIEEDKVSWPSVKSVLAEQTQQELKWMVEHLRARGARLDETKLGVQTPEFIRLPRE
jgi:hypothetical protein